MPRAVWPKFALSIALLPALACLSPAQDNSNWTSSSDRKDPNGNLNPTRTRESHTESNGRSIDRKTVETLGPDGRYVPYLDTETETVRVDANTTRTIERSFGRGPDGQRTLTQQTQQQSRTSAGGETNTERTVSNPDLNGGLRVVQRETQRSRQISPDTQETKTTILTPDGNGGLSPSVQIDERQKKNSDGAIDFKKSTSLAAGEGRWQVGEVREGTRRQDSASGAGPQSVEERVLRPDSEGNLAVTERTVTRQTQNAPGDQRETRETYSTDVPGVAGNNGLKLVQRETTVSRSSAGGDRTTTRQVEKPTPGSPSEGMRVTDQAIDIVRPGAGGVAQEQHTVYTMGPDGGRNQVWVDVGKTDNPAVVKVDTAGTAATKPK
jgi:hypothetical protein